MEEEEKKRLARMKDKKISYNDEAATMKMVMMINHIKLPTIKRKPSRARRHVGVYPSIIIIL